MTEGDFKRKLCKELNELFPDCVILKNDPSFIQGIPDLIVLWHEKWAALEVKKSCKEVHRPNQDYYIDLLNEMSWASYISPEYYEYVLDDLVLFMKDGGC